MPRLEKVAEALRRFWEFWKPATLRCIPYSITHTLTHTRTESEVCVGVGWHHAE